MEQRIASLESLQVPPLCHPLVWPWVAVDDRSFRSFRFKMLPTWLNDTPFRGKDCRESIYTVFFYHM